MIWSQGFIDDDEKQGNNKCEVVSEDPKFDEAVKTAVSEIGAPKYNAWAYPTTTTHFFGARNCQTWIDDVLNRASELQSAP